jgi:hypothetical protein
VKDVRKCKLVHLLTNQAEAGFEQRAGEIIVQVIDDDGKIGLWPWKEAPVHI